MKNFCLLILYILFSQYVNALEWKKLSDGVCVEVKEGKLRIQVCKDDVFRVMIYPESEIVENHTVSVIKYDWKKCNWKLKELYGEIVLSTKTNKVHISNDGTVSFYDNDGKVLLKEKLNDKPRLEKTVVSCENVYKSNVEFLAHEDEAIYGLAQVPDGVMDFKDYFLNLRQFNTVIALPFYISTRGYGLFWNNTSLTQFNPERKKLDTRIQSSWDSQWLVYEPEETGEHVFILENLHNNASVYVTVDELKEVNGFEERERKDIIKHDYDVIPSYMQGRVFLEKGKKYEINIKANFKQFSVKTPSMMGKTEFESEVADVVDYYFFAGNADNAIKSLRELTGDTPMFPRWAFGLIQSRFTYDSQKLMMDATIGYRSRKYPVDVIVQDMNYWDFSEGNNTWGSHIFDPKRYSDPKEMFRSIHDDYNAHTMVSVWPRINKAADIFDYFVENGYAVSSMKKAEGNGQEGITVDNTVDNITVDVYNPEASKEYWRFMKERLWDLGVDGWWLDASEPESNFHDAFTYAGSGARHLNTYSIMQSGAIYNGQRETTSDKRVVILTRSAFIGQQRYATQCWSGDIGMTWNTYKQQIAAGLNFCATGMSYWSSDIGGFRPYIKAHSHKYRELVTRWFQYGTFLPMFRVHGCRDTELWKLTPEEERIMLKYDRFRYRMLPYIYSLAWKISNGGYTMLRALPLDFPDDKKVRRLNDEYMFGNAFLVCPITEYKDRSRKVYLPDNGGKWFDFWTGEKYEGGTDVMADAPADVIPLFVPEGTILPLGKEMEWSGQLKDDVLEIRVYPGKDAEFTLYEDENDNYNYEKGKYSEIKFKWDDDKRVLTIDKRNGSFDGILNIRTFNVVLVNIDNGIGMDESTNSNVSVEYKGTRKSIKL